MPQMGPSGGIILMVFVVVLLFLYLSFSTLFNLTKNYNLTARILLRLAVTLLILFPFIHGIAFEAWI